MKDRIFWLTILGAATVTIFATAFLWIFMLSPLRQAVKIGNDLQVQFVKLLNLTPRITANNAVLFAQNTPSFELVTVERSALVRHRSEETWLHSTKTFEIEAKFTAHAGLNLRDTFSVNIPRGGGVAEIRLPRPKILSLEMGDLTILRDEDGLWNKLTSEDREKAIRTLTRTAKTEFLNTDILKAATEEAEKRIREITESAGCRAVFSSDYSTPPD